MTWRTEDTDEGQDLVYDGMEAGIAPSPHKGTANIQNANISTEQGEVLASFGRTAQQQAAITNGTLTPSGATLFDAPASLKAGTWISVSASTVTSISTTSTPASISADYLIVGGGGGGGGNFQDGGAGGGGAGEDISSSTTFSAGAKLAVTVGTAGAGGPASIVGNGGSGTSSAIATIDTAVGGGGGGLGVDNVSPATDMNGDGGASGGGGGGGDIGYQGTGGTATAGNNGGAGHANATVGSRAGGGGGGSSSAGAAASAGVGGAGGAGTSNSITGTAVLYAAGGGGGCTSTAGAGGSSGAGGAGADSGAGNAATTPGSGGGGSSSPSTSSYVGGDGADGIVVISYDTGAAFCTGGTVTRVGTKTIHTFTTDDVFEVVAIAPTNLYFVSFEDTNGRIKLSNFFDPYSSTPLTHGITGSITFSTVAVPNQMISKATENYNTATDTEYRYYMLDVNGYLWCYDTQVYDYSLATFGVATTWMLVDPINYSGISLSSIAVLNGNLMAVGKYLIFFKPTVDLGSVYYAMSNGFTTNSFPTNRKFAITGTQGKMYYTDNQFIGEVFPTTSFATSEANIQSYCKYTASSTTGTISVLINGSIPYLYDSAKRVPAIFFTDSEGTLPTAIIAGTVYYIEYDLANRTFEVYDDVDVGQGTIVNIATGAVGNQYFNTFFPNGEAGPGGTEPLVQFTPQRLNRPFYEQATSLVEIGNIILVGCEGSAVYPWNQIDASPSDVIQLPERNVQTMINVNNMAYIFAGNKANVYISNGSVASLALKVPDYCAGVPGTPNSYIEPYFTWADAMFLRGRVYCSVLDQTATKAGNCGGVWSFIPTGNMASTDAGLSLRLENQNSYGDYDGYANILLPSAEQNAISPQYWSAWQDSYLTASAAFGIDTTSTTPVTSYVIETDIIPTGTLLSQDTFTQLEYKLSTNALTGDTVQLYYRLNSTAAWVTCGTANIEANAPLSGYYDMAFQKTQWLQFRAVCTTPGTTTSSFTRLAQIRLR